MFKSRYLLLAVFSFLALAGCLQLTSKSENPSPQIIYVNATPQVIVTVQQTIVPTIVVTEKVIYPSVSVVPKPMGGLTNFGERVEFVNFDFSKVANSDYHSNPFFIGNPTAGNYYPDLKAGEIGFEGVPFSISPDYKSSAKWSVLATSGSQFFSANFLTGRTRFSEIYFLLSASFKKGSISELARIRLNYEDGEVQEIPLVANTDVWNYEYDAANPIPKERLVFDSPKSDNSQTLTYIKIKANDPLKPISGITIKKTNAGEDGAAIFAATGVRRFITKQIKHTVTEFQEEKYDRIRTTTLTEGAIINYDSSSGKRIYRADGTFESPILDGETDLAKWKLISWGSIQPNGTKIKIEVRTGMNPKIDGLWSPYQEVQIDSQIPTSARFLQWKATLSTTNSEFSPTLKEMRITFENPVG
ncbi:hypothetical protein HY989_04800 [Candidatus Micrarchaeota archaeon]|nr:hypothetical protein [Candidatus Micrarchaeota archaeon]